MIKIFAINSPFLLPPFLRREEKREKNNQSRGQKSYLSALSSDVNKQRYFVAEKLGFSVGFKAFCSKKNQLKFFREFTHVLKS